MANRTAKDAHTVKGTNPQFLVEKIIRQRIYDSKYWKEHCFALSAELIVDRGMELRFVGGIYAGNVKPTPFLCLSLKMLQIQPDKDIVIEFIRQEEFKYIRALGAMYLRLTFPSIEIYKYLEPLYNDYRKLRFMNTAGRFELVHMDEFIDNLLRQERYCDIQLPRLQKRIALEELNELDPYKSLLDDDLDALSASDSEDDDRDRKKEKPSLISKRERSRSRERDREYLQEKRREKDRDRRHGSKDRDDKHGKEKDRERDRDRHGKEREKERSRRERSRSRDRGGRKDKEKDRSRKDDKDKKKNNDEEREIEEANALRASLGLAPLQR